MPENFIFTSRSSEKKTKGYLELGSLDLHRYSVFSDVETKVFATTLRLSTAFFLSNYVLLHTNK